MKHRAQTRRRRGGRLDDIAIDALALVWVARGMWRVRRGRLPWKAAPSRRPSRARG